MEGEEQTSTHLQLTEKSDNSQNTTDTTRDSNKAKPQGDKNPDPRGTAENSEDITHYWGSSQDSPDNGTSDINQDQDTKSTGLLAGVTVLAGLGGFLFGYDTGVITGALLLIKDVFHLSTTWQEAVVAATTAGAAVCSLIGGLWVVNITGRRCTVILASAIFLLGAVLLAAANGVAALLAGRIIVGLAIGLASVTVPMYIAECAPAHLRGRLGVLFQMNIVIGIFIAVVVDAAFSYEALYGWRWMFGLSGIPALIQLIGMFFMPESPRWLVSRDRKEEAGDVLMRLHGIRHRDVIDAELRDIVNKHHQEEKLVSQNKGVFGTLVRMLTERQVRKALLVGCGLQMFQQLVGINTVMYYSATIISMVGVPNNTTAIWLAAAVSAVNVLSTGVGIYLVDKQGRRFLLLISIAGICISLVLLSLGFIVAKNTTLPVTSNLTSLQGLPLANSSLCSIRHRWCNGCVQDISCGFCTFPTANKSSAQQSHTPTTSCVPADRDTLKPTQPDLCPSFLVGSNGSTGGRAAIWSYDSCQTAYGWIVVLGMILYVISFAIGMGPIPWIFNAEIYPLWARAYGCALSTATNWFFNLIISMTFLTLAEALTKPGVFGLYAGLSGLAFIFTYLLIPETKGLPLEAVEQVFYRKQWAYQRLQ